MEKIEIKTLDMVRQIRDQQYEQLKGKSPEEVLEFYRQKAAAANAEAAERLEKKRAFQD